MSGAHTASRVDRVMQREGTTMTLKRRDLADLDVKGRANGSSEDEIGNTAAQSQRTVRISNGELSLAADTRAPRRGDKIRVDSRDMAIVHVDTKKRGAVVVAHVITCIG